MSSTGPVFQNAVYVGVNLQDILYGIELVLYFKTMRVLLYRKAQCRGSDVFYAIFSTVMLLMTTIWVSTQAIFGEKMWLEDADFPGGPDAYWAVNVSVWYMDLGTTAIIALQLMTDALMIYRCKMIWYSHRIIIVPIILWMSTLVLGVLVTWTSSSPGGNFFRGVAAQLGLVYYSVSVAQTLMLTLMICCRMATHGREVEARLGQDYASVYFAVIAIIVESVLPYSLSGIAFLVSLGVESPTSISFACVYTLLMCISPQMLILRVASGRAWQEETGQALPSSVKFTTGDVSVWAESPRGGLDDNGVTVHTETYSDRKEGV